MEFIVFLITIQLPFVYLVWRFFKSYESKVLKNLRISTAQNERMSHMIDTLRLSLEKSAEDIYKKIGELKKEQDQQARRLNQLEEQTGLRVSLPEEITKQTSLQNKNFS